MDAQTPLHITLFGGLSVKHGDRTLADLPSRQTAALLAYLALNGGRKHPREELQVLLWPDSTQEKARQNLRQCLRSLRDVLEQPPFAPDSVLLSTRSSLQLNPELVRIDTVEFERAIEAARGTADRAERARHLARAMEVYRGELLPGFYQDCF